jgi:uncharacterized protein YdeI (YjbR/CyaY-like superfamily)
MGTRDPRTDAYIAKSADFAKPILTYLREVVHEACPEVQETSKWSSPFFDYKGTMCQMAAFKEHCAFGFWKGSLVVETPEKKEGAGSFGAIRSIEDLPPRKTLIAYIKKAAKLNEDGVKSPTRGKRAEKKPEPTMPDFFAAALKKNKTASKEFEAFSPSCRREYIDWLTEAKSDATREKRLATALEWIAEGKQRNWKYQR